MRELFWNTLQTIPWALERIYAYIEDYIPWGWLYYVSATDYMMKRIQTKLYGSIRPYFENSSLAYYDYLSFGLGTSLFVLFILISALGSWIYWAFNIDEFADRRFNSYFFLGTQKEAKGSSWIPSFLKGGGLPTANKLLFLRLEAYLIALAYLARYCYIWVLYILIYLFLVTLYLGQVIYPVWIIIWSWRDIYEFYDFLYFLVAFFLMRFSNRKGLRDKDRGQLLSFIDSMGTDNLWTALRRENKRCKRREKLLGTQAPSKIRGWRIRAFFFMTAGFIWTYATGFFLAPYYLRLLWTLYKDFTKIYVELEKEREPLKILYWVFYGLACLLLFFTLASLLVHLFSFTFPLYGSRAHWYWICDCYRLGLHFWLSWLPYIALKYGFSFFKPQEKDKDSFWDIWK